MTGHVGRVGRVYCGNTIGWSTMFEEPPECTYEGEVPLGHPQDDRYATWHCPQCGLENLFYDHEVTDS